MDTGANMFVDNNPKHFTKLIYKKIKVELGAGVQGHFHGVGLLVVSHPSAPSQRIILYPTFFAPRDSTSTISNGALKAQAGFSKVIINTGVDLSLTHRDGSNLTIPFTTTGNIDYLSLTIHVPTKSTRKHLHHRHMSLQPASVANPIIVGSPLHSWTLHIKYNHRSLSSIQKMIDSGFIKPKCKLAPLPGCCPI